MIEVCEQEYVALETALPDQPPYVLLKTGLVTEDDRWSILGWDPWLSWMPIDCDDPLGELDALYKNRQPITDNRQPNLPIPFLMGALSYDLGRTIEVIPSTATDDLHLPQAVLYGFRRFLVVDERERRCWKVVLNCSGGPPWPPSKVEKLQAATEGGHYVEKYTKAEYLEAVSSIRDMIAAGDCYQVNLSQRFVKRTERTARAIFQDAVRDNPAPMMSLIDTGHFQLISTSPERLLRREGTQLTSQPIKGTAPRGETPVADAERREALLTSEKDRAELAMIVDLIRNDLGRVAKPGSVAVEQSCRVESYTNVHHLVATVTTQTGANTTWGNIFRAVFPGGSITGCPKIQAMRVIEAFERVRRGFYCGSIGYIDQNGDGDWSIAIRTLTKINEHALFHLGGGIVYDSEPQAEYAETLSKGETLFAIL